MGLFSNASSDTRWQATPRVAAPEGFTEIPWTEVGPQLVGRTVHVQYDRPDRFEGGVVAGYGSDFSKLIVRMQDGSSSTGLRDSKDNPQLFVKND